MHAITIDQSLDIVNGCWEYKLKFSDNDYLMTYKNLDIQEVQARQAIMDKRIEKFFRRESNELKTSDIGFTYTK